jgi:radical SAM protein with 4Fe4S-binding SPASM domain
MDTLLKKNIDFFRVSTEGWDNESMMKYRGQKFDRVYRNVKDFYKYSKGKKTRYQFFLLLHIYPSMTEDNIRQMFDLWGECSDHIQVSYPLNPSLNHEKAGPPVPVPEESFGDYYYMVPKKVFTCNKAIKAAYIQPNGDVLPCCEDYAGLLKFGNIHDEDFIDIFMGKRATSLREEFKSGDPKSCGKCYFFYEFAPGMDKRIARLKELVPARYANRFDIH